MTDKKINWIKAGENVRYYKHPTRKAGPSTIRYDRYFNGYYKINGRQVSIGFGWESQNWTAAAVKEKIDLYKTNAKLGLKPTTLKEDAEITKFRRETEAAENNQDDPKKFNIKRFYDEIYLPAAQAAAKGNKKKQHSLNTDQSYFKNWIMPPLGQLHFNDLKKIHFLELKTTILEAGRTPRTLQQCFAIFNKLWNYACDYEAAYGHPPSREVKLPKVDNECTRFFTPDESKKLLDDLLIRSPNVHDMTLFGIHTGARRGEIFDLTWSVINFDNMSCVLRDAKGETRHSYLSDAVAGMLRRRLNSHKKCPLPKDRVFINRLGHRHTEVPRSYNTAVDKLKLNEGVTDRRDKVTFHTTRHTFASWHVQYAGTDLYVLKDLMGHSTIKLTERYAHLRKSLPRLAAKHFNNFVEAL